MKDEPTPCSRGRADHTTRHGHPACSGHKSETRGGGCCQNAPALGLAVCRYHGAAAAHAKAAGERRQIEANAAKVMRRFGEPIDTTPTEALLDAVKWTAGYVAWLREKVAEAESDHALIWGVTKEADDAIVVGNGSGAYVEHVTKQTREAAPNVWLELLGVWHDRLVKICAEAIKAGIEERRVRLAEAQGQLLANVIKGILADLKLTAEQEARVSDIVPRHLRAVAG